MGWHAICPDMLEGEAQEYYRRADGGSTELLTEKGKGLNWSDQPSGPPGSLSHNAGAWAKFGRPEKRLRFSRAAEFGRARMAEPGPQGPQRFLR